MFPQTTRFDLSLFQKALIENQAPSAFETCLVAQEILSRGFYPASKVQRRLDFVLHEFNARTTKPEDALESLSLFNDYFYDELGFRTASEDRGSVDQNFFGKVFETRNGSNLALALIYKELTQRLIGATVQYVNFPGLALVKILYKHQLFFIDPSEKGRLLSIAELQERLYSRYGQGMALSSSFLETPPENHMANRFLTNLKNIYFDMRQWDYLLGVLDLLVWLNPAKLHAIKERGLLLYQLGFFEEAKADLARFIHHARPSAETEKVSQLVEFLKSSSDRPVLDQ